MTFKELFTTNLSWSPATELFICLYDQEGDLIVKDYKVICQIIDEYKDYVVEYFYGERVVLNKPSGYKFADLYLDYTKWTPETRIEVYDGDQTKVMTTKEAVKIYSERIVEKYNINFAKLKDVK